MAKGPRFSPAFKPNPSFMGVTPSLVSKWVPTLGIWGGGTALFAGVLFLSAIPRFQTDVLLKTPLAPYYADKTPDSDKPF